MQNHADGDKPHISDLDETLHEGISLGAMNFGTNHMVGMLVHFISGVTTLKIGRFWSKFLWKIPWFGWPIPQNCEEQNIWYSLREFGIIISKQWQDQNIRRVAYKILALFIRRVGFARWNLAKKWVFLDTLFITFHTVFNSNVNLYIYPHACSLHRRKPIGGPVSVVGATTLWLSWHVTYFCFLRQGTLANMGRK